MGCFKDLALPWRKGSDLEGELAGAHLEENFRFIDQWANPLEDSCAGCPDVARGEGGNFSGTVAAATSVIIDDSILDAGPGNNVTVAGDMTWDGTSGGFIVPRDGLYLASISLRIDCTPVTDPYWIGLTTIGQDSFQLPPFNVFMAFNQTLLVRMTVGQQIQFQINNNETASVDLDFENVVISAVEIPCSSLEEGTVVAP